MPAYSYEGLDDAGRTVRGRIDAESPQAAQNRLAAMGYIPVSVQRGSGVRSEGFGGEVAAAFCRVSPSELILFTKQFKTMLAAGLPLLKILSVLEQQSENSRLRRICARLTEDVRQGASISAALAGHESVFSQLYVGMVRAGETAGALPQVLDRLITILAHEQRVRADIKAALQYPLTVLLALIGAFFFLLTFVVPVFARIFSRAKVALPWPTQVALALHTLLDQDWPLLLGSVIVLWAGLYLWFRTEDGKVARDAFWLHLPVLGLVLRKSAISRFASIFAILQTSGVPVLSAMDILADTIGNAAMAREFCRIEDRIRTGHGLAAPLAEARYFTPMVVTMVAVGEETGKLDTMLAAISEHYDAEVAYAIKRLSDALGPALIVGLAVLVGFFALAIFLPMWDMSQVALRH